MRNVQRARERDPKTLSGQDSIAGEGRSSGCSGRPGYATSRIYKAGSMMPKVTASSLCLNGNACVASWH